MSNVCVLLHTPGIISAAQYMVQIIFFTYMYTRIYLGDMYIYIYIYSILLGPCTCMYLASLYMRVYIYIYIPIVPLKFFIDVILPAELWPSGRLSL
jgi:hypothetical protein